MEQTSPNGQYFKEESLLKQTNFTEYNKEEGSNSIKVDKPSLTGIDNRYLNNWIEIKTKGKLPERRSYCSSASYKNKFFVYGGYDLKDGVRSNLYSIDLNIPDPAWECDEIKGIIPPPAYRLSSSLSNNKLFLIGGIVNNSSVNTIYTIDLDSHEGALLKPSGILLPNIDSHSSVCSQSHQNIIYIYGGYSGNKKNNIVYIFDIESNTISKFKTQAPRPPPRSCHSAVMYNDQMLIFGGNDKNNEKLNDLWSLNLSNGIWQKIENNSNQPPSARSGHSAINIKDKMYIFGGCVGIAKETNDLYSFNLIKGIWETIYEKPLSSIPDYTKQQISLTKQPLNSFKNTIKANKNLIESPKNIDKYPEHPLIQGLKKSPLTNKAMIMLPKLNNTILSESDNLGKINFEKEGSLSPQRIRNFDQGSEKGFIPSSPTYLSMKSSLILNIPIMKWKKTQTQESKKLESGLIHGKSPCERDGHSVANINDKMVIFGGDRHQMSFNDIYIFCDE